MMRRSDVARARPEDIIDAAEFSRFLVTGIVATLANMTAVWTARHFMRFEWSLIFGIAAGATVSFLMSKIFAFRSRSWNTASGEAARFALVYCAGLVVFWVTSVAVRPLLLGADVQPDLADMAAVLAGAAPMTLTSYLGHRFFTYRRTGASGA